VPNSLTSSIIMPTLPHQPTWQLYITCTWLQQ